MVSVHLENAEETLWYNKKQVIPTEDSLVEYNAGLPVEPLSERKADNKMSDLM